MHTGGDVSADSTPLDLELLMSESAWLRALARSLVRDESTADDLVQETWLAALRKPPEPGRPLRPWLARVLSNFARMRARSEAGRVRRERSVARVEVLPDTGELIARTETQRSLARVVLEMDDPYRTTLLLRYYEGLSAAEIARRTDTPAGTVRWRLKVALDRLRDRLDADHDGDRSAWSHLLLPLAFEAPARSLGLSAAALAAGGLIACLGGFVIWKAIPSAARRAELSLVPTGSHAPTDREAALLGADAGIGRRPVAAQSPAEEAPVTGDVTLDARIVDPRGRPLDGARLSLVGVGFAASGADGGVHLSGQASSARFAGLFTLELSHPHAATRSLRAALVPGAPNLLGDLVLEPGGAVAGIVRTPSGGPLADALVLLEVLPTRWKNVRNEPLGEARLFGSGLGEETPRTRTDAQGRFRFDGIAIGYVRLWAVAEGYLSDYSMPVGVRAGECVESDALVPDLPGTLDCIAGVVVGPTGDHVPYADLEAGRASTHNVFFQGETWSMRGRAGPDGRFNLAVGGFPRYDLAARDPEGLFAPVIVRRVKRGQRGLELRLERARRVSIEVLGKGGVELSAARLVFLDGERVHELSARARRGDDGWPVPHVPFLVRAAHAGYRSAEIGPFEPDDAPEQLTLRLEPARQLRGVVRADGEPLAGARVELLRALPEGEHNQHSDRTSPGTGWIALVDLERSGSVGTETDAHGAFALDVLEAGRFWVRVESPDHAPERIGPLRLDPARRPAACAIELGGGGAIEGRVLVPAGARAAGRVVGVSDGDGYVACVRADAEGAWRIAGLRPGAWQVLGLEEERSTATWSRLGSPPVRSGKGRIEWDLRVAPGATSRFDLDLREPSGAELSGRLSIDGEPSGAGTVLLTELDGGAVYDTGLDPAGRFSLRVLTPGRYKLEIVKTGYRLIPSLVHDELDLSAGSNTWELKLETGVVKLENVPTRQQLGGRVLHFLWEGEGDLYCTSLLNGNAAAETEFSQAPAGRSRIVSTDRERDDPRKGRTLERIDLPVGGEREVRL
jgi:RNA polymerase sigma-70 factor (ECF subfamily)